jgi:phage tail-like protein
MPSEGPGLADPWANCYFSLEVNGTEVAYFLECSGFKSSSEPFFINEGGFNGAVHSRPGYSKWDNITLKHAMNASTQLLEWRDKYMQDDFSGRESDSGAIVIRDRNGDELRRYSFVSVWPVSWEGTHLKSGASDIAIDTVEIAFASVYLGKPPTPPPDQPQDDPIPDEIDMGVVQFDYDKDTLKPAGEETVDKVDDTMDKHNIQELWVEGHTCDMGTHSYNQQLSQGRADACADRLKSPSRTIHSNGYSYDYPKVPNDSEAHRRVNRRTQFFTSARSGLRPGEIPYKSYK